MEQIAHIERPGAVTRIFFRIGERMFESANSEHYGAPMPPCLGSAPSRSHRVVRKDDLSFVPATSISPHSTACRTEWTFARRRRDEGSSAEKLADVPTYRGRTSVSERAALYPVSGLPRRPQYPRVPRGCTGNIYRGRGRGVDVHHRLPDLCKQICEGLEARATRLLFLSCLARKDEVIRRWTCARSSRSRPRCSLVRLPLRWVKGPTY
jgi:hypothetical protein